MTTERLADMVQEALRWLAEPYGQQIDHLKRMGVWPSTDELALELDDIAPLYRRQSEGVKSPAR
jgi:hypothetical protein